MIVNDLHLLWSRVGPHEADPPLVIDPDAVLTDPIALKRFESIARRDAQILKKLRGPHLTKLAQRHRVDPGIDRWDAFTTPQTLGFLAPERPDHTTIV